MSVELLDTPWKIFNEMQRWLVLPAIRLQFAFAGIPWGKGWRFHGTPIIQKHRGSLMCFGDGLGLRSSVRSNPLGPNHPVILTTWRRGAILKIGRNFAMTGGTICASNRITIGDNVTVGANSVIIDTDFHPTDPVLRRRHPNDGETAPIIIEDEVFIGMNCFIMKGVILGKGCVVGAGSVVTKSVPAGAVVAGNPAKMIREAAV